MFQLLCVLALLARANAKPKVNVLFVGNSLTFYSGGIARMLTAISRHPNSVVTVSANEIAHGEATFADHVNHHKTPQRISERTGVTHVVLQEQSGNHYSLGKDQLNKYRLNSASKTYPEILIEATRNAGAVPILYMTWYPPSTDSPNTVKFNCPDNQTQIGLVCVACDPCPPTNGTSSTDSTDDRTSLQPIIDKDYTHAAAFYKTMCAPAGNALLQSMSTLKLKREQVCTDALCHPTRLLQYLNALVMYATITDTTPVGLGDGGTKYADYTTLQNYAWEVYSEYKQREQAACTAAACVQFASAPTNATADTAVKDNGLSTEAAVGIVAALAVLLVVSACAVVRSSRTPKTTLAHAALL